MGRGFHRGGNTKTRQIGLSVLSLIFMGKQKQGKRRGFENVKGERVNVLYDGIRGQPNLSEQHRRGKSLM